MGLLNEELRPQEFKDVFLIRPDREKIEKWANSWQEGTPIKKGIILSGPPGYGKTSIAYALSRTMNWEIIEINSSEVRTEEFIKKTVGLFARYGDLFSFEKTQGPNKVALIDEADHIYERGSKGGTGETGGYKAISEILKETKIPIIITMNEYEEFKRKRSSSVNSILSYCETVEIKKIFERKGGLEYKNILSTLADRIIDYAQRNGYRPERSIITEIISSDIPDIRAAINDCEAYIYSKSLNPSATDSRDSTTIIFDTLRLIFHGDEYSKVKNVINESDTAPEQLILWISQNIPTQSRNFSSIIEAMEYLSEIDLTDRRAHRFLYFRMMAYLSDLEALMWTKIEAKRGVFIPFRFSNYLTMMSKSKKNRGTKMKVARSLSEILHMSREDVLALRSIFLIMSKLKIDFPKLFLEYANKQIDERNRNLQNLKYVSKSDDLEFGDFQIFLS